MSVARTSFFSVFKCITVHSERKIPFSYIYYNHQLWYDCVIYKFSYTSNRQKQTAHGKITAGLPERETYGTEF